MPWRMAAGTVDGQPAVIGLRQDNGGQWIPHSIVRVDVTNNLILRVVDYSHCPWVAAAAGSVAVDPVSPGAYLGSFGSRSTE